MVSEVPPVRPPAEPASPREETAADNAGRNMDEGVEADEWLPPGSSALVAVVDDHYLDQTGHA